MMEKNYREKAISRYSSLFTLPSARRIYALLVLHCLLTGVFIFIIYMLSVQGFLLGLGLGGILSLATFLCNYITCRLIPREDTILDFRRTSFLSLVSNIILSIFMLADMAIFRLSEAESINLKASSLGFFSSLTLRILVFRATSFVSMLNIGASAIFQPSFFIAVLFIPRLLPLENWYDVLPKGVVAVLTAFLFIELLIRSINKIGNETVGIPSLHLFRAFFANWTEGEIEPLEDIFEKLGEERDVEVSMLAFRSNGRMKTIIVIPSFHPGPFKNVGSSCLPSIIQKALENKFGCVISVQHGISGHGLDLASQCENMKVLNNLLKAEFRSFKNLASPFTRVRKEGATADCQVFDRHALVIVTLSPHTTEDMPFELKGLIEREAKKYGFFSVSTIDAHNSINGDFIVEKIKKPVLHAASSALEKAANSPMFNFKVGASKIVPPDLSIQDGMGPGGINVVIVEVNDQKTAYITIDGNNMVSGLREKIIFEVTGLGLDYSEVMTTDTHAVNAVVSSGRGYHPIGEAIDHDKLIGYIKDGVKRALENLESAEVSYYKTIVSKVKVIGEQQIDNLCMIVDEVSKKIKRNSMILLSVFIPTLIMAFSFL